MTPKIVITTFHKSIAVIENAAAHFGLSFNAFGSLHLWQIDSVSLQICRQKTLLLINYIDCTVLLELLTNSLSFLAHISPVLGFLEQNLVIFGHSRQSSHQILSVNISSNLLFWHHAACIRHISFILECLCRIGKILNPSPSPSPCHIRIFCIEIVGCIVRDVLLNSDCTLLTHHLVGAFVGERAQLNLLSSPACRIVFGVDHFGVITL